MTCARRATLIAVPCPDCGEPAPPFAADVWLRRHRQTATSSRAGWNASRAATGAIVSSLQAVAGWSWMHGRCGLVEPEPLPRQLRWGRSPWVRVH